MVGLSCTVMNSLSLVVLVLTQPGGLSVCIDVNLVNLEFLKMMKIRYKKNTQNVKSVHQYRILKIISVTAERY